MYRIDSLKEWMFVAFVYKGNNLLSICNSDTLHAVWEDAANASVGSNASLILKYNFHTHIYTRRCDTTLIDMETKIYGKCMEEEQIRYSFVWCWIGFYFGKHNIPASAPQTHSIKSLWNKSALQNDPFFLAKCVNCKSFCLFRAKKKWNMRALFLIGGGFCFIFSNFSIPIFQCY